MQFQCKKIILAYLHRFSLGCSIRTWDKITTATFSTFTSQYLSLPTCIYYIESIMQIHASFLANASILYQCRMSHYVTLRLWNMMMLLAK